MKVIKIETTPDSARYHIRHGLHTVTYDIPNYFTDEETERTLFSYMKSLEADLPEASEKDKDDINQRYNDNIGKKPWYKRIF